MRNNTNYDHSHQKKLSRMKDVFSVVAAFCFLGAKILLHTQIQLKMPLLFGCLTLAGMSGILIFVCNRVLKKQQQETVQIGR